MYINNINGVHTHARAASGLWHRLASADANGRDRGFGAAFCVVASALGPRRTRFVLGRSGRWRRRAGFLLRYRRTKLRHAAGSWPAATAPALVRDLDGSHAMQGVRSANSRGPYRRGGILAAQSAGQWFHRGACTASGSQQIASSGTQQLIMITRILAQLTATECARYS
jgi:hypothetical protein